MNKNRNKKVNKKELWKTLLLIAMFMADIIMVFSPLKFWCIPISILLAIIACRYL